MRARVNLVPARQWNPPTLQVQGRSARHCWSSWVRWMDQTQAAGPVRPRSVDTPRAARALHQDYQGFRVGELSSFQSAPQASRGPSTSRRSSYAPGTAPSSTRCRVFPPGSGVRSAPSLRLRNSWRTRTTSLFPPVAELDLAKAYDSVLPPALRCSTKRRLLRSWRGFAKPWAAPRNCNDPTKCRVLRPLLKRRRHLVAAEGVHASEGALVLRVPHGGDLSCVHILAAACGQSAEKLPRRNWHRRCHCTL